MRTALLVKILLFAGFFIKAQVGINTSTPQATLDVNGKPTDNTVLDGIIAPRITGDQLRAKTYTAAQTGAMVYVSTADTAPAGQTIDVTTAGYYYFNGTKWVTYSSAASVNLYNTDGTLTANRTVTLADKSLTFDNTYQRTLWGQYGGIIQSGQPSSPYNVGSIQAQAPDHDGNGITSNLYFQAFSETAAQVLAGEDATALNIGTHFTTNPASINFVTTSAPNVEGTPKATITGAGNMGINTGYPTEKLDIDGISRIRSLPKDGSTNAINTTPDGDPSDSQDQTFTATKTVVADANGVLGYVDGPPFYQNIRSNVITITGGYTVAATDYLIVTDVATGGSTITFPNLTAAETGRTVQIFNNNSSGAANNLVGATTILGQVGNNAQRGRTLIWTGSVWVSVGI